MRITLLFCFILISKGVLFCQDSSITAEINLDTVYLGNSFSLQIESKNTTLNDAKLELDHCNVRLQHSASSRSIVNGIVSSSLTKNYIITPSQIGLIKIPSFEAQVDQTTLYTEELTVVVVPNPNQIVQDNDPSFFSKESFPVTSPMKSKTREGILNKSAKNRKRRKF